MDGDFYINTAANTIYGPKSSGSWGTATSIVGPQGPAGPGIVDATSDNKRYARKNAAWVEVPEFTDTVESAGRALTNADFSGNRMLSINAAGAVTLTIPTGLTGREPLLIYQMGAGQVTIGGAATLRNRNGLKTAGQYAVLSIIPRGSDIYVISGDVTV